VVLEKRGFTRVVLEKGQLHPGGPGERAASPGWSWRKGGFTQVVLEKGRQDKLSS